MVSYKTAYIAMSDISPHIIIPYFMNISLLYIAIYCDTLSKIHYANVKYIAIQYISILYIIIHHIVVLYVPVPCIEVFYITIHFISILQNKNQYFLQIIAVLFNLQCLVKLIVALPLNQP